MATSAEAAIRVSAAAAAMRVGRTRAVGRRSRRHATRMVAATATAHTTYSIDAEGLSSLANWKVKTSERMLRLNSDATKASAEKIMLARKAANFTAKGA